MENDYVEMLKQELIERRQRRPEYSERAFARDIEVSPGFLSLIFHRKRLLSQQRAFKISARLSWTGSKVTYFLKSVNERLLEAHASDGSANGARAPRSDETYYLELDHFNLIADPLHFAILELVDAHKISTLSDIEGRLQASSLEVSLAVSRLQRLELLKIKNGFFAKAIQSYRIKEISSEAIRKYHRQILEKGAEALDRQPIETRHFESLTLSFDEKKIIEAKAALVRFQRRFEKQFGKSKSGSVYQFNMQMFRVDHPTGTSNPKSKGLSS